MPAGLRHRFHEARSAPTNAEPPQGSSDVPLPSARRVTAARRNEPERARGGRSQTRAPFPPSTENHAQEWNARDERDGSSSPGEGNRVRDTREHSSRHAVLIAANRHFRRSETRVRSSASSIREPPESSTDAVYSSDDLRHAGRA